MPMRFSNGKINILTLACDRRGGFTTRELGWIHEALPILSRLLEVQSLHRTARSLLDTYLGAHTGQRVLNGLIKRRSEEHTSELQSLMRISYAVFCLKKKKQQNNT